MSLIGSVVVLYLIDLHYPTFNSQQDATRRTHMRHLRQLDSQYHHHKIINHLIMRLCYICDHVVAIMWLCYDHDCDYVIILWLCTFFFTPLSYYMTLRMNIIASLLQCWWYKTKCTKAQASMVWKSRKYDRPETVTGPQSIKITSIPFISSLSVSGVGFDLNILSTKTTHRMCGIFDSTQDTLLSHESIYQFMDNMSCQE